MKQKGKRKSKHDLPSLDFVTALSVEECRERLLIMNRVFDSSRRIDLAGDRDFYIEWLFHNSWARTESWIANIIDIEHYVAHLVSCRMSYWGSLTEGDSGTRIQLIPTQEAIQYVGRRASLIKPLNTIGIVVYGTLMIFGGCGRSVMNTPFPFYFSAPVLLFVFLSLLVFGPLVYFINVQLKLSHNTRREVEQIYQALYVPQVSGEQVAYNNEAQQFAVPRAYPPGMQWQG